MNEIKNENLSQPDTTFSPPAGGDGGKILVTGGTGFLGSYIIKNLLEKGYSVRAIRRSNKLPFWISKEIFDKVEWIEGDVLDVVALEEAMEGVDTVIHSAAVVRSEERRVGKECA